MKWAFTMYECYIDYYYYRDFLWGVIMSFNSLTIACNYNVKISQMAADEIKMKKEQQQNRATIQKEYDESSRIATVFCMLRTCSFRMLSRLDRLAPT